LRVIAIANHKGGSAKTTTTVNLAAALAELERRVLVVDLDPQASSSWWLSPTVTTPGASDLFTSEIAVKVLVQKTATVGVSLIPADGSLTNTEKLLAARAQAELTLRRRIKQLDASHWHYVLIDTPPTLGLLTVNALVSAREVIIPVEAHVLALSGVSQLLETVERMRDKLNPELRIAGVVACRVDSRTRHSVDVVESLQKNFGKVLYATKIRENVRLAEAPSYHQPITAYDGRCAGADDYRALAAEVIAQEPMEVY